MANSETLNIDPEAAQQRNFRLDEAMTAATGIVFIERDGQHGIDMGRVSEVVEHVVGEPDAPNTGSMGLTAELVEDKIQKQIAADPRFRDIFKYMPTMDEQKGTFYEGDANHLADRKRAWAERIMRQYGDQMGEMVSIQTLPMDDQEALQERIAKKLSPEEHTRIDPRVEHDMLRVQLERESLADRAGRAVGLGDPSAEVLADTGSDELGRSFDWDSAEAQFAEPRQPGTSQTKTAGTVSQHEPVAESESAESIEGYVSMEALSPEAQRAAQSLEEASAYVDQLGTWLDQETSMVQAVVREIGELKVEVAQEAGILARQPELVRKVGEFYIKANRYLSNLLSVGAGNPLDRYETQQQRHPDAGPAVQTIMDWAQEAFRPYSVHGRYRQVSIKLGIIENMAEDRYVPARRVAQELGYLEATLEVLTRQTERNREGLPELLKVVHEARAALR